MRLWSMEGHLRRWLRRRVSASLVDDLMSETYLVAWRRIADVPDDDPRAMAWLMGVAQRLMSRAFRTRHRQEALALKIGNDLLAGGHHGRLSAEERVSLVEGWRSLSRHDREVLTLAAWETEGNGALASRLGCSVGAATTRVSRARSRLKDAAGL